jgi:hypothetical protein
MTDSLGNQRNRTTIGTLGFCFTRVDRTPPRLQSGGCQPASTQFDRPSKYRLYFSSAINEAILSLVELKPCNTYDSSNTSQF